MTVQARVGGYPHRIVDGIVERRVRGFWRTMTRSDLLAEDADGELWEWLRAKGIKRPAPSGPSGTTQPESERRNVQVLLRLAPEVAGRLRDLATESGVTASAWVAARVIRS